MIYWTSRGTARQVHSDGATITSQWSSSGFLAGVCGGIRRSAAPVGARRDRMEDGPVEGDQISVVFLVRVDACVRDGRVSSGRFASSDKYFRAVIFPALAELGWESADSRRFRRKRTRDR